MQHKDLREQWQRGYDILHNLGPQFLTAAAKDRAETQLARIDRQICQATDKAHRANDKHEALSLALSKFASSKGFFGRPKHWIGGATLVATLITLGFVGHYKKTGCLVPGCLAPSSGVVFPNATNATLFEATLSPRTGEKMWGDVDQQKDERFRWGLEGLKFHNDTLSDMDMETAIIHEIYVRGEPNNYFVTITATAVDNGVKSSRMEYNVTVPEQISKTERYGNLLRTLLKDVLANK